MNRRPQAVVQPTSKEALCPNRKSADQKKANTKDFSDGADPCKPVAAQGTMDDCELRPQEHQLPRRSNNRSGQSVPPEVFGKRQHKGDEIGAAQCRQPHGLQPRRSLRRTCKRANVFGVDLQRNPEHKTPLFDQFEDQPFLQRGTKPEWAFSPIDPNGKNIPSTSTSSSSPQKQKRAQTVKVETPSSAEHSLCHLKQVETPSPDVQSPKANSPECHSAPPKRSRRRPLQHLSVSQYMDERNQRDVKKMQAQSVKDMSAVFPSGSQSLSESRHTGLLPSFAQSKRLHRHNLSVEHACSSKDLCASQLFDSIIRGSRLTKASPQTESQCGTATYLEEKYVLFVKDLAEDVVHHQVSQAFSSFGNLKRVHVLQHSDHSKYAVVVYSTEKSLQKALNAGQHHLNGQPYICHRARPWHLALKGYRSEVNRLRVPQGVNIRTYIYPSKPTSSLDYSIAKPMLGQRTALLPQSSVALLNILRKKKARSRPIISPQPLQSGYPQILFAGLGENYKFERHTYTNFVAYRNLPGLASYEAVPIDSQVGLTAEVYAGLRENSELMSTYFQ